MGQQLNAKCGGMSTFALGTRHELRSQSNAPTGDEVAVSTNANRGVDSVIRLHTKTTVHP